MIVCKCKKLTRWGECDWPFIGALQDETKLDVSQGVPEGDVVPRRVCNELLMLQQGNPWVVVMQNWPLRDGWASRCIDFLDFVVLDLKRWQGIINDNSTVVTLPHPCYWQLIIVACKVGWCIDAKVETILWLVVGMMMASRITIAAKVQTPIETAVSPNPLSCQPMPSLLLWFIICHFIWIWDKQHSFNMSSRLYFLCL